MAGIYETASSQHIACIVIEAVGYLMCAYLAAYPNYLCLNYYDRELLLLALQQR